MKALITELKGIKSELADYKSLTDPLNARKKELEEELMNSSQAEGMHLVQAEGLSVSVTETIVPQVDDWEKVESYIKDTDSYYLYPKKILSTVYRELLNEGTEIPGTSPFTQRRLNVRKAST